MSIWCSIQKIKLRLVGTVASRERCSNVQSLHPDVVFEAIVHNRASQAKLLCRFRKAKLFLLRSDTF